MRRKLTNYKKNSHHNFRVSSKYMNKNGVQRKAVWKKT